VARVRAVLASEPDIEERRMMGGLVFLKHGNMLGGVDRDRLFVRVGAESREALLGEPQVGPMDIGGRAPKGFVLVDADGIASDAQLQHWVGIGLTFATSLPPKAK
jgi:TfoX/Sxy family transcriptional regulator of competence genes